MTDELRLCVKLLRGDKGEIVTHSYDFISPALVDDYGKVLSARQLGNSLDTIAGEAALCRSALTTYEDDRVRIECVQQLLNNQSPQLETVLFGLLFDEDEELRLTAIEGLVLTRSNEFAIAASIVAGDESSRVRQLMHRASSGDAIDLNHLDPPPTA